MGKGYVPGGGSICSDGMIDEGPQPRARGGWRGEPKANFYFTVFPG